jgi:hypothetical protein
MAISGDPIVFRGKWDGKNKWKNEKEGPFVVLHKFFLQNENLKLII